MAFTLAQANSQLDLLAGFKNQLQRYGRTMSVVDSPGGQFPPTVYGLLTTLPMIDPRLDLGDDPREATYFTMVSPAPANLQYGVELMDQWTGTSWMIRNRENNSADYTTKFWLTQITAQDS